VRLPHQGSRASERPPRGSRVADWAELDAIDNHASASPAQHRARDRREGDRLSPARLEPSLFQAGVLQHSAIAPGSASIAAASSRSDVPVEFAGMRQRRVLLSRFSHQRTRHIVAISPPRFCRMTGVSRWPASSNTFPISGLRGPVARLVALGLRHGAGPARCPMSGDRELPRAAGIAGALVRDLPM